MKRRNLLLDTGGKVILLIKLTQLTKYKEGIQLV